MGKLPEKIGDKESSSQGRLEPRLQQALLSLWMSLDPLYNLEATHSKHQCELLRLLLTSCELFYDYRWAGHRTLSHVDRGIVVGNIWPVEYPYKIKYSETEGCCFKTRWQCWHPCYDSWEPEANFRSDELTVKDSFRTMLEVLGARLLLCACMMAQTPSNTRSELMAGIFKLDVKHFRKISTQLTELVQSHIPTLNVKALQLLQLEMLPLRVTSRSSVGLLNAFKATIFRPLQVPRSSQGKPIIWADDWERLSQNEERGLRFYTLIAENSQRLLSECRMPRHQGPMTPQSASDLASWRDSFFRWRINNDLFYVCGSYTGPIIPNEPRTLAKLWLPPWLSESTSERIKLNAALLLPPYSTFVRYVPDAIIMHVPARLVSDSRDDVFRVSCRVHYGHTRPFPIFLTRSLIQRVYPHLLNEWCYKINVRKFLYSTWLETLMIVPTLLLYGGTTKYRSIETARLKYPLVEIEYLGPARAELDWSQDPGLAFTARKWDILRLYGPLDTQLKIINFLFDHLHALKLGTEGHFLKCTTYLFLDPHLLKVLKHGTASLQACAYVAGFPFVGGKSCVEIPNLPEWEPRHKGGFSFSSSANQALFQNTLGTIMESPLLLYEAPCQLGHALCTILVESVRMFINKTNPIFAHMVQMDHLINQIIRERRCITSSQIEEYRPTGTPTMLRVKFTLLNYYSQCMSVRDQLLSELLKCKILRLQRSSLGLRVAFLQGLQICLVTYGSPAPLNVCAPPKPFAHVSSLGNLVFDVTDVGSKDWLPPWKIVEGDKELEEVEDDEVLSSDEVLEGPKVVSQCSKQRKRRRSGKSGTSESVPEEVLAARKHLGAISHRLSTSASLRLDW